MGVVGAPQERHKVQSSRSTRRPCLLRFLESPGPSHRSPPPSSFSLVFELCALEWVLYPSPHRGCWLQEMTAMAQAEAAAKEQCRAAQAEAEGHLAVLGAKQQQDDVLKSEIARLTAEVGRAQSEAHALRTDTAGGDGLDGWDWGSAGEQEEELAAANARAQALQEENEALQTRLNESQRTVQSLAPAEAELRQQLDAASELNSQTKRVLSDTQVELTRVSVELRDTRRRFKEREEACAKLQHTVAMIARQNLRYLNADVYQKST